MRRFEEMAVAVVLVLGAAACGGGDGGNAATGDGASATASVDAEVEATGAATTGAVPQAGNLPTDLALPSGIELSGPTLVQSETEFVVTAEIAGNLDSLATTWADGLRSQGWEVEVDDSQDATRNLTATKDDRVVEITLDDTGAEKLPLTIRGRAA